MTTALQPTTGAAAVADFVRDAIEARTPLRVVGGGTWLDAGGTTTAARELRVRELSGHGIVEFVPGDLTLTARAGTTLDELARTVEAEGLWLPLDPAGSEHGTIGATVATASSGPLATGFGTPRDMVLGLEAVTGRGDVIRGGGRVVKNVAGFDLTRLLTGSWGTLGVLTEVSLRLRARPECDETLGVAIDDAPAAIGRLRATMRQWPFAPIAAEILNAPLAGACGMRDRGAVALVRIAGNADAVADQRARVVGLGDTLPLPTDIWNRLRAAEPARAAVIRLSLPAARLGELWDLAGRVALRHSDARLQATPARGIVRCVVPTHEGPVDLTAVELRDATVICERRSPSDGPPAARPRSSLAIERRLYETFNPHGVLNPGLMPGVLVS